MDNKNDGTQLLLGKIVSESLEKSYISDLQKLRNHNIIPSLAVILIGDNPASKFYVKNKAKYFTKMNCYSETINFPSDVKQNKVINKIEELNNNIKFHGILVQLPIPMHINKSIIFNSIDPNKDVDGFSPVNFGQLFQGRPNFVPCTPNGIIEILNYYNIETQGKNIVIIGRSNIVCKPLF